MMCVITTERRIFAIFASFTLLSWRSNVEHFASLITVILSTENSLSFPMKKLSHFIIDAKNKGRDFVRTQIFDERAFLQNSELLG